MRSSMTAVMSVPTRALMRALTRALMRADRKSV
ncbi:MAG: hypothetical protein JWQ11_4398, partial [Rhizobacter sp.]|nr:hypothetical protein [Rhizobacter sp.]